MNGLGEEPLEVPAPGEYDRYAHCCGTREHYHKTITDARRRLAGILHREGDSFSWQQLNDLDNLMRELGISAGEVKP